MNFNKLSWMQKMHAEGSSGDIHEPSPGRTPCGLDWVHECPRYCLRRASPNGLYPDYLGKIHHDALAVGVQAGKTMGWGKGKL